MNIQTAPVINITALILLVCLCFTGCSREDSLEQPGENAVKALNISLFAFAKTGQADSIKNTLSQGARIDAVNRGGNTALVVAVDSTGQCNTLCFNQGFGGIGYGTTKHIWHDSAPEGGTLASLA